MLDSETLMASETQDVFAKGFASTYTEREHKPLSFKFLNVGNRSGWKVILLLEEGVDTCNCAIQCGLYISARNN